MVDYYSMLLRAVTAPGAGGAPWRQGVYDRARRMLASRLRSLDPPPPHAEIIAEESALEAAIERVEAEVDWTEHSAAAAEQKPAILPFRASQAAWIVIAIVAAALGAGGYVWWVGAAQKAAPPVKAEAQKGVTAERARSPAAATNVDLAPGIDGGNSDPDMAYVFRRQPTFYRTLQPVGTIIVDKAQHFLYLIQPNNVALRYGVAIGRQCADLAGLRHIASMTEWPPWQPPAELLNRNPAPMHGGAGNPLGARLLALDDGTSRIHGTNAPKTIGNAVTFGCIRLVNDDISDLYGRVKVSTPVVMY
jgi:lipoprotein-anchoring transpeptidase ErfK/SrfK